MKKILILLIFTSLQVANADVPADQKQEIELLLDYVRQSDCLLKRNGSEHTGKKAVSHIQKKYDYFRDDIKTTEDFIKYSATKSTMSGKYYTIRCTGEEETRSSDWLLKELYRYRRKAVEAPSLPANK
jgi:hypothetical protein